MTSRTRPCPQCQGEVSWGSRYCPECHALVNPNAPEDPMRKEQEEGDMKSIILVGLGGMALFFSFGFFLPAVLSEASFFWIAAPLFVVGASMMVAGALVRRRTKKRLEAMERDLHVRCEYCGGTNHRADHRCTFCGAPIIDRAPDART